MLDFLPHIFAILMLISCCITECSLAKRLEKRSQNIAALREKASHYTFAPSECTVQCIGAD